MPLIFLLGVVFPRLAVFLFWIFTNMVVPGVFLGILGLIFLPYTLLCYTITQYWFLGLAGSVKLVLVIVGLLADFGIIGSVARRK